MRRITSTSIAIALAMTFGVAAGASAQPCAAPNAGPFSIDGCVSGGVTTGSNSKLAGNAPAVADPNANAKELGPINASSTKLGVINTAPTPMLGQTNPNGSVDLNTVYTQTAPDASGDIWYYFGWIRDSNNGTGFISIELQNKAVPAACTGAAGYAASGCNPWSGRSDGDLLILWDQQGGSTDIYIRKYSAANHQFGTAVKLDPTNGDVKAQYGTDLFRGEVAINFSNVVFASGECQSFANTIPGTVTGNSDSADYKDAVLSPFAPVSNCGSVTITKVTQPVANLAGSFQYTLSAQAGDIFDGTVDSQCATSAKTECVATLTSGGDSDTIAGLLPKSDYTLAETSVDPAFELVSITCSVDGAASTDASGHPFSVVATKTTACVITNRVVKVTPSQTTTQAATARIFDEINLTGIKPNASDAGSATVTFRLYSNNVCSTQVGTGVTLALTYNGTTAKANTLATAGFPVALGSTYYWRVEYTGDAFNNGFTTPCGQEQGTVTFSVIE